MRPAHPFKFGYLALDTVSKHADWFDSAKWAEDNGYQTFQVVDHVSDPLAVAPLVQLAAIAATTSSIRLGTLVLNNDLRNPGLLAKEISTLDSISRGRFEIGLGAGWQTADYTTLGLTMESPGLRIARLEETVQILKPVLGSTRPVAIEGGHYQVQDLASDLPDTQLPRPPVLIGGGRQRILSLAARHADIVSVNRDGSEGKVGNRSARSAYAEATNEKLEWIRAAAGDRFADLELHLIIYLAAVTERPTEEAARIIRAKGWDIEPQHLIESPHSLIGPLPQLIERVIELRETWGFSYLTILDSNAVELKPLVDELRGK